MKKQTLIYILTFSIAVAIVVADQITKAVLYGQSYSVWGDFLWVESSFNTGAAFSFLSGKVWLFICISVLSCAVMIYFICSTKWGLGMYTKISLSLVLGGAIGNLIDRIMLGGVRDFIYLKSINFAIFNVADMAVTVGAIALVISVIIDIIKTNNRKSANGTENNWKSGDRPKNQIG